MKLDTTAIESKVRKAVIDTLGKKIELKLDDSFVATLGFNSLRMVSLSLALEDEFQTPLLLNDWIAQHEDPKMLTVGSLCQYVGRAIAGGGVDAR